MIRNKEEYRLYLDADLRAAKIFEWKWHYKFKYEVLYFQRMLRKVEYYQNCKRNFFSRIYLIMLKYRFNKMSIQLGLTIPRNSFGPGMSIAHYGSIVVNSRAKIGANCRIHSATNIGEIDGKAPLIGDNCYIGPGAVIYGDITIGNNVAIGANSVVNKSFPDNVTVVGAPAKVISKKGSGDMIVVG